MGFFDSLALKAAGGHVDRVAGALQKVKFGVGYGASALIGGTVGGIVGLAKGDNYDSTATLRNFTSGAAGGLAAGLGLRAAIPRLPTALAHVSGMRHAYSAAKGSRLAAFRSAPMPRMIEGAGKLASNVAAKAMKVGGALGRHPGLTTGAAVLGGAAIYMNASGNSRQTYMDSQPDDSYSRSEFMASTQNLVQGLHRSRHRNG